MPPLARLAAALKVGLLAALLAAAGCGQNFLQNSQEEDGHWSAARFGGQPEADLQVTAWIVLAYLGDGSTIRSGKFREVLKPAVVWLRRQQDDAGRFGLRGDPGWVFDHALVTFAFAEVIRLSPSKLLGPPTARAAAVLAREIEVMRPEVSAEIRLFARMTVTSLRAGAEAGGDAVITAAEELDDVLAALEPVELVTDRDRAAADLLAAQRGESVAEPAKKGEDGETDLPAGWPADLAADPVVTFYRAAAAFKRGGAGWDAAQRDLKRLTLSQRQDGELRGSWDPASGAFAEWGGRLGVSAVDVLVLEIYYRYCRLGVFTF